MSDDRPPRHPVLAAVSDPDRDLPFVPGNTAELLVNGARFFPAMLDDMRAAQRSITLETFIWRPGRISNEFIELMCEHARGGIKVHVLVDDMKYGSVHEPGMSVTFRASGGFGCAPLPALDHPRT